MEDYEKYGSAILKFDSYLFHWSNEKFENISRNQFYAFNDKVWMGKYLYIYRLKYDIKLMITFDDKKPYSHLPEIFAKLLNVEKYDNICEVNEIKKDRKVFDIFCDKISNQYIGICNLVEPKPMSYTEIVIFDPVYLERYYEYNFGSKKQYLKTFMDVIIPYDPRKNIHEIFNTQKYNVIVR